MDLFPLRHLWPMGIATLGSNPHHRSEGEYFGMGVIFTNIYIHSRSVYMNKSITQQMHEAFLKSQKNGMDIRKSLEERYSSLEKDINRGRNTTMNYLNETDKGFYVPQSEYYRKGLLDGEHIKRRSITEQDDLTDEEKEERERQMAARNARTQELTDIALAGSGGRPRFDADSDEFAGRRNEADVRSRPDFDPTAPGASDQLRRAQVRDQLGVRGTPQGTQRVTASEPEEGWDEWNRKAKEKQRSDNLVKYGYQPADEFGGGPPAPGYDERKAEFEAERDRQKADQVYKYRLAKSQLERDPKTGYASPKDLASIGAEYDRQSSVFKTQEDRARDKFMQRGSDFKIPDLASTAQIGVKSAPGTTPTGTPTGTTTTRPRSTEQGGGGAYGAGQAFTDFMADFGSGTYDFFSGMGGGRPYGDGSNTFRPDKYFPKELDTSRFGGMDPETGQMLPGRERLGDRSQPQWNTFDDGTQGRNRRETTNPPPATATQDAVRDRGEQTVETPAASNRPGSYNAPERPPADAQSRLDDRRKKAFQNIRNTTRYA
jgi:hypothetical protein